MTTEHGAAAEELIERLCRTMFLADFTVRSPPFKKGSGIEKEAADVLVPFGEILIAFQVKSKKAPENAETAGETYLRRVEKTVSKGIDQLKTIKRALNADQIEKLKNAVGVELPFDPKAVKKLIGVVVLDLPDQRNTPQENQIAVFNGYEERHGIPAHVFRSDELEILTKEIDTLPDFLAYLEAREALFSTKKIGPLTTELNLLALYKTHPEYIDESINNPRTLLFLDDELWESYQGIHEAHIKQRNIDNEPAFIIDRTIEWLHTSIGFSSSDNYLPQAIRPESADDVRNYAAIALELARLPRIHRRVIGRKWLERMIKAEKTGLGYSVAGTSPKEAFLVMSSSEKSREERVKILTVYAAMAYCHMGFRKLLGIITEPISAQRRSYDFVLMDDVDFENDEDLRQRAKTIFGPTKNVSEPEFRSASKPKSK